MVAPAPGRPRGSGWPARLHALLAALLVAGAAGGCSRDRAESDGAASAAPAAASAPAAVSPAASVGGDAPGAGIAAAAASSARGAPAPRRLVVVAGGDVNLARELGQEILRDPASVRPFAGLDPILRAADLRLVNLESQLSDQGGETQSPYNRLVFTGPPGGAEVLAASGIDVVSLANNHMWDYGKRALFETLSHLERAGVATVGATRDPERMYEPLVIRRGAWSIALFAVTHIWNQGEFGSHEGRHHVAWARFDRLAKRLEEARRAHDVVLVSYHGGAEYLEMPMAFTKEYVGAVMRWGADAVLGHHPHVPQGVGWHRGRPVFYSLGNLVFGMHREHEWTGMGLLARLTFERPAGCEERSCQRMDVEACPYRILGTSPLPFSGPGRAALDRSFRQHLTRVSHFVGGTSLGPTGEDGCFRLTPPEAAPAAPGAVSRGAVPAASSAAPRGSASATSR